MRSEPSKEKARDLKPEPGVRVRYVVSVEHLIHLENAQHEAKSVTNVAIKIILALNAGPNNQEEGIKDPTAHPEEHKGKGKCQQSRSRSNQVTKSAYSMESASFQDHPDLHGEKTGNLHGESANLHGQRGDLHGTPNGTQFFKQSFSTISRLKSVASISNDTDPEGKTKILTVLQLKLPHHSGTDDITVKVDNGAEGNILPLNSFRAMFPHVLDANGYPKAGFLRGFKTMLECYDDGKLVNHGSIKLKLQHYSEKSFQDHSFYVVETKKPKPIIVGHPASIRLGLIQVLCKNISKSVLAIEKMTENSMRNSFQDHPLRIDSKTPWRWQRSKSESSAHSFQDHLGTGNLHGDKNQVKVSFQDHPPNVLKVNLNLAITRP